MTKKFSAGDIVTYFGSSVDKVASGTPFVILGFCDGECELIQTSWFQIKYKPHEIQAKLDSLESSGFVLVETLEKYFVNEGKFENKVTGTKLSPEDIELFKGE